MAVSFKLDTLSGFDENFGPTGKRILRKESHTQQLERKTLKRQYSSSLYERLALSRDKEDVLRLSSEGATPQKPSDILHTPYILEFSGLDDKASYHESDLEQSVIDKMQNFLLEMGKGFLFEQRQKRFTFHDKNFYLDLVLYNRFLRGYVLIDFKIDELTHQDLKGYVRSSLGQYVRSSLHCIKISRAMEIPTQLLIQSGDRLCA